MHPKGVEEPNGSTNMARRRGGRSHRSEELPLISLIIGIVFLVFMVSLLIRFLVGENPWIILIGLGIVGAVTAWRVSVYVQRIRKYKDTPYYRDTRMPYADLRRPGIGFEVDVYNALHLDFPHAKFIPNALIAREDAVNQYFEIDVVMISRKGAFAIELKDWAGMIYGGKDDDRWDIGRQHDQQRIVNSYYNPYKQNEKHIEDLNKIHPFDYHNHVIFSQRGNIGDGMEGVSYYKHFVEHVEKMPDTLDEFIIKELYAKLNDKLKPHRREQHIERIKYNQKKYSNRRY